MAISARDIFLSVRVSDRATRPLRQISSELRRMQGTSAGVASQRRRLEAQQIANVKRQQRLIDNITSATSGRRRVALDERVLKQREAEARAASRVERSQSAITANQLAQRRAAQRISSIQEQPGIDAANRRRLQAQRRDAERNITSLGRRRQELEQGVLRAQQNVARQPEVEKRLRNDVKDIESRITGNLAQQERLRARLSKLAGDEVSIAQMRAEAAMPLARGAGPPARALHLQTRALFEREAVLLEKQRAAQAALANFPKIQAAAEDKLLVAKNAVLKNTEAQLAAETRIAELQTKIAATPTASRSRAALQKDLQAAQLSHQQLTAASGTLQRDYETAVASQSRILANNQNLIADEQQLARDVANWKTELQSTQGQLSKNSAEMSRLSNLEQRYLSQENLQKWSQRARLVEHLGHVLTITGLAATAAFGLAAKSAADFSTQAVLAATQARPPGAPAARTGQIAQRLNQVVLNQMQRFPASAEEMQKALYDIFSGTNVQNVGKAAQLLRIFNKEAIAGGTDLDTMVQAGITLYNNFPREFRNMTAAGDRFFALVRYGRGTAEQFAQSLSPIIPIAKQAGQNFDDVAGTLAFLSRQSRDTTQNAQGLARLLLLLARPEVRAGFNRLGISVTDAHGKIRPLLNIISELKNRVKLSPVEALTFFKTISQQATGRGTAGTIQAQRVWARLYQGAAQYRVVSRQVLRDNNEFKASFEALSRTPGVRWRIFTNQLKALVILIGEQAIPAFTAMGAKLVTVVHWFRQLSPHTQHMIGYLGAFAAVGTLVGGILLTIGGGLASLYFTVRLLVGSRGIGRLEAAMAGASRSGAGLAAEAGFASTRLMLMLGVVGPLLFVLYKYPGILRSITGALGGTANALKILGTVLTATVLARRLGFFSKIATDASFATASANVLRASLLRLGAIGVIAITISLLFDPNFRQKAHDWMHRQTRAIADDWRHLGHDATKLFTAGQVDVLDDSAAKTRKYWAGQFREYQQVLDQHRRRIRTIVGRTRLPEETAQLRVPVINEEPLRRRLAALRNRLRTATVFERPQILHAIARIRTQLELPRNAQAMIDRARAMADLKMKLPLDKRALAREIGSVAAQMIRTALPIHFQLPVDPKSKRAITRATNIIRTAAAIGVPITPSFQKLFDAMIKARRLADQAHAAARLDPTRQNLQKDFDAQNAYQKALTNLRANASKEQVAAATKAASAIDAAQKKQIQQQKENLKTATDNVTQMYNDLYQQNQQFMGTLFQGPFLQSPAQQAMREWGVQMRPRDLLKDLKSQINQFQRFQNALNRLSARGAPPQLIQQLRQLGPEALPQIELLTKMAPSQFRQYIAAFQRGQNLIKRQTMRDLRSQLALYRSFGKNVGRQIVLGIRDQSAPMKGEIRKLVLQMFPELKVGTRTPAGARRPHRPEVHNHTHHHHHEHDHTNVNVKPGSSLSTELQRDRFRKKHRPRQPRIRR